MIPRGPYGKENEQTKIINFFFKKITKKFNIFYYLRQLKSLKIIRKSTLEKEQTKMISLISSKEYNIARKKDKKNPLSEKDKNSRNFNYFMYNYNPNSDSTEQRILNYFIEDN